MLAPGTFLRPDIYVSFAQTTPYFAIVAMVLTMVIVAGDIDLSFPSIMALGMVGFVSVWEATGSVELGILAALAMGAGAGLFNGLFVTLVGYPGAGGDHRHPVPVPGPHAGARERTHDRPGRHAWSPPSTG